MVARTQTKKKDKVATRQIGENHKEATKKAKTVGRKQKPTGSRQKKRRFFLLAAWDAVVTYLRDTRMELSKVRWPTREEWMRLTGIVLLVTGVSAVFLGLVNYLFTEVFSLILRLFT